MKDNINITIPDNIEVLQDIEENISKIDFFSNCFSASFINDDKFVYCNIYKADNKVIIAPTVSIKNSKENSSLLVTITNYKEYRDITLIIENADHSISFKEGKNIGDDVWEFKIKKETTSLEYVMNEIDKEQIPITLTVMGRNKVLDKNFATTCDINLFG
ncbi:MAG: hypothetical protein N4A44_04485 [Alphaproteobacteria bacterium]|jgi:TusA-related sulfurtransferase|nr:hypothetical protein [Alphaproteobacteria bacterium]